MTAKKKKPTQKKKSESTLSIVIEGQVFLVKTLDGKDVEKTEIDRNTVGLVIRAAIEEAIHSLCVSIDAKDLAAAKKPGKKK